MYKSAGAATWVLRSELCSNTRRSLFQTSQNNVYLCDNYQHEEKKRDLGKVNWDRGKQQSGQEKKT